MSERSTKKSLLRWLTLYMLVGLAILLFVVDLFPPLSKGASTNASTATAILRKSPGARVTQTAPVQSTKGTQQTPTASANNFIALDPNPLSIPLTIADAQALINGDTQAKQKIALTVQQDPDLQGKTVALVVIYVGIAKAQQTPDAQKLTTSIMNTLEGIPSQKKTDPVFGQAVYRSVIYQSAVITSTGDTINNLTSDLSKADLRVYLYKTATS